MHGTLECVVADGFAGAADAGLRRVHLAMTDAVLGGESLGRVAALAAGELGSAVAIVLPGTDVAVVEPFDHRRAAVLRRYVSDRLLRIPTPAPEAVVDEAAIVVSDDRLGFVLLVGYSPHPRSHTVLQLAALAAATAFTLEHRPDDLLERCGALFTTVRAGSPADVSEIVVRSRRLGCDLAQGATALCVRGGGLRAGWALATIADELPSALVARRGDDLEALLPVSDGSVVHLVRRLRRGLPVGFAPFERDVAALGRALRFAELAATLGEHGDVDPEGLLGGTWRLLLRTAARDAREIDGVIAATIGPALSPEARSRADLVPTLRTYLEHNARIAATARTMDVHRHTIRYRLGRIGELTGHNPQTTRGQAQLSIGMKALVLRGAIAARSG